MPSLSRKLLHVAEEIVAPPRLADAFRRRAVSTAYYALFHRFCALCASHLMGQDETADLHRRAYRALEHSQARRALKQSNEFATSLGAAFEELQDIRSWADYSSAPHYNEQSVELGKAFTPGEARACVEKARQAIETINNLDKPARRRLATLLLVRDRR
jgi:uncharacterized protein (UPF0332 family)